MRGGPLVNFDLNSAEHSWRLQQLFPVSDSSVDTLPTIKRGREVKRSTGGERGWGKDKKKGEGHRRVEVSGEDVRKEKVTRWRARGKNREEEEEEDVTGQQPAFLPPLWGGKKA